MKLLINRKLSLSLWLVNYRHEQDIYVRMIDSITKQVRLSIFEKILSLEIFFCSQSFMKVKIKTLKCAEFY